MKYIHEITEIDHLLKDKACFVLDFDGTIADTENLHWEAYNQCLAKYNVTLGDDEIKRYIGHTEFKIYDMIRADFQIQFDNETFLNERLTAYFALAESYDLVPFSYVHDLLTTYPDKTYIILSSQKRSVIDFFLEKWQLQHIFTKIFTVFDDKISKESFLANTVKYTGYAATDVVLFEDTNRNLELAKQYHILPIGVEHKYNKGLLQSGAAIIVGELIK